LEQSRLGWLFNLCTLLKVVSGTQDPHIVRGESGAAFRKGQVMVEVQLVSSSTNDALSLVTFIDRLFHPRRDRSGELLTADEATPTIGSSRELQGELEDLSRS